MQSYILINLLFWKRNYKNLSNDEKRENPLCLVICRNWHDHVSNVEQSLLLYHSLMIRYSITSGGCPPPTNVTYLWWKCNKREDTECNIDCSGDIQIFKYWNLAKQFGGETVDGFRRIDGAVIKELFFPHWAVSLTELSLSLSCLSPIK